MIKTQENIALGRKIKELRELKGLTQEQLSTELGMSQTHISQVEQGVKGFSRKTLKAAADILNTTIGYLLGEIDSPDLPLANTTNEDMENEREPIALRIAESRKKLGLSQAQFAQMHGFALPTFARWEVGKTEPKASDIKALARALSVSVAFFAWGEYARRAREPDGGRKD